MTLIIAPTEPQALRDAGDAVSLLPETYGADVFFTVEHKNDEGEMETRKVGIQRKEYHDLLASVMDGRLAKEVQQMQSLDYKVLIIEGTPQWTNEGQMVLDGRFSQPWTLAQWRGLQWSVRDRGIWVCHSLGLQDTISIVKMMERWFGKSTHTSLSIRPGLGSTLWGGPSHDEFAAWMLQGIPMVGPEIAKRIVKMYGLPLKLMINKDQLMAVEGIGKVKAEKIMEIFGEGEVD